MIRFLVDVFRVIYGCAAVVLALFVVMTFVSIYTLFRVVWWLFNLPAKLMGASWAK